MTITVIPITRMSAASFPTNAASLKMICTIPGQLSTKVPAPRYALSAGLRTKRNCVSMKTAGSREKPA
jgi:hypothetical protein